MTGMVALGSHSFNYLVPAAIIRVMAMVRTAGRYGEMMVSHHAVFGLLQRLRVRFLTSLHACHWQIYQLPTLYPCHAPFNP